jgi:hypothetical protein
LRPTASLLFLPAGEIAGSHQVFRAVVTTGSRDCRLSGEPAGGVHRGGRGHGGRPRLGQRLVADGERSESEHVHEREGYFDDAAEQAGRPSRPTEAGRVRR